MQNITGDYKCDKVHSHERVIDRDNEHFASFLELVAANVAGDVSG